MISFSESDDFLVTGVSRNDGSGGTPLGLGYFGFAYFEQSRDTLKALDIDAGKGPVAPTRETINSGQYEPLSRPLFIYISKKAAARPEVQAFVEFYLDNVSRVVADVGYIEVTDEVLDEERQEWEEFIV
jgi:phosphate transport system substrate-binding protein